MDGRPDIIGTGPILVFHCHATAPLRDVTLADLYDYLNNLIQPFCISKYIVCTDDKQDRAPLTDCCARIPNCEVVFMSQTFYAFNVCDHLLWYLNRILVPGTLILITNIEDGYYYAAIKTIQDLGWRVILANQPSPVVEASQSTSTANDTSEMTLPKIMHDFLTGGVVHMTPLDLPATRQLMDNFKATICTLDDWPFFPPDYPMPSYDNRTESRLMKLMDIPIKDGRQTDIYGWGDQEEEDVSTCSSMSYVDCFFGLDKMPEGKKKSTTIRPKKRIFPLNRSHSTPPAYKSR